MSSYYDEKGTAYGVLVGCAVASFFLAWGFNAFIGWWATNKESLSGLAHILLYLVLIALSLLMFAIVILAPYQSVKMANNFSPCNGVRYILFGIIGLILFAVLFFTHGKNIEWLMGVVYFAIVLGKGVSIYKNGGVA